MRVLVVNAGSSSLKLRVLDPDGSIVTSFDLPVVRGQADVAAIAKAVRGVGGIDAVGHRIVHGGTVFTGPVRIDPGVEAQLRALTDLAPLHQPKSLAALDAVSAVLPDLPAVASFDTAFHADMPAAAATYAVPIEWRERWGVRRYGFHGLSHAYAGRRAAEMLGRPQEGLRVVTCHLGAGASLCAVLDGRSVDTTMGFTPLEGLVMATRSGNVDPGLVMWLLQHAGLGHEELADALEHRSGLHALAGTSDMRQVLEAADEGSADAQLALEVYIHRLRAGVASMAAAMEGMDVLVFTGGVGERAPAVRELAAEGLGFLGIGVDSDANEASGGDRDISAAEARVRSLVVEAREDLEIAREVRSVLG
ncbi:MAG: acetate/propionate family kinase [Pseudonocardia sp.]|nr:acetate/propionate family kinase [Pseudonocardia sp.]